MNIFAASKYIKLYISTLFLFDMPVGHKVFAYLFMLTSFSLVSAQIGLHGDAHIASNAGVGVFSPGLHFFDGHLTSSEEDSGYLSFHSAAHGLAMRHDSHSQAPVISRGHSTFVFPVGDQDVYQPLKIDEGGLGDLKVAFKLTAFTDTSPSSEVEQISNRFYWEVSGNKEAKLSLSWNSFSELSLLTDDLSALVMVGFDGTNWEIIPAILEPFTIDGNTPSSLSEGAISSIDMVEFGRFQAVTLGSILLETTLKVSEGITPNGDDINDHWFIKNIERYPNAQIWVYNRWGVEVFSQAGNYTNDWDGTYKDNSKKLPSAPYYYQIDQDNDGSIDLTGWIYINY